MKIIHLPLACLAALPLLTFSPARAADSDLSAGDKSFVQKAAQGGMFEVQSSQVAQEKATSPDIKDFAAMMVTDHGKANDELKSIAGSKGLDVPSALDAKHQAMLDALNGKSGKDFDTAYLQDMEKGHSGANALFKKEAASGQDTDIKAIAAKTDQTIEHHIAMLHEVEAKTK
jgi:putative membrane protein